MNPTANSHRTQVIRISGHWLGAAIVIAIVLTLVPTAHAAPPVTFAEFGQRAGQIVGTEGIAVDQASGDVYVAENSNRRVSKFDATGNFLLAFGAGVADGTSTTLQVCGPQATPPTKHCFRGVSRSDSKFSVTPNSVAVDQSSGDIYLSEGDRVSRFSSDGEFLLMFGKNVDTTPGTLTPNLCTAAELEAGATCGAGASGSGPGEFFASARTVFVEQGGSIWVGDTGRLIQFDSSGQYVSEATITGAQTNSFVRNSSGDFYAIKAGVNERQSVNFTGYAEGDTFRVGNLPAGCSSSNTAPIEFAPGQEFDLIAAEAFAAKCGSGSLRPFGNLLFGKPVVVFGEGKFTAQNLDQLTCETVTGSGSCSVTTLENGVPGEVVEFEASGSPVDTLTPLGPVEIGAPRALALGAADTLYVGDAVAPYRFKVFNAANEQISQFGAGQVLGIPGDRIGGSANAIAVGESAESLYSVSRASDTEFFGQIFSAPEPGPLPGNESGEDVLPTTATLTATLNPEGNPTTYFFEYGIDETYGAATPVSALPASGFDDEAVEVSIDHLTPDTTYHFRLVATNNCNPSEPAEECTVEGEDTTFTTLPAIQIGAQWITGVTATTAVLHGELNPLGVEAEAWLEYGNDESYGQVVRLANLGDGFGAVPRVTTLTGLESNTAYHYRFVARDERDGVVYTVPGPDRSFVTQINAIGFDLADERAWEMVSPVDKHGARLVGSSFGIIQASRDGGALAYLSFLSMEREPEGSRTVEPASTLARRDDSGSWNSRDLVTPGRHAVGVAIGNGSEYKIFSPGLSRALLEPRTDMPLSPDHSERTPYLRHNTEPPIYTPLITAENVPPGTEFGGDEFKPLGKVHLTGANDDLDQIVVNSDVPLVDEAPPGAIYLWAGGELQPVSVLPGSEGGKIVSEVLLGSGTGSVDHAIADDGSRVFWGKKNGGDLAALYMRDSVGDATVRLDVVQPGGTGLGTARPTFQGASADGTVVFFTDTRQLTEDASPDGADLYRCEIPEGAEASGCSTLTDVSAPLEGSGESAEVQGIAAGLGEDAESIYFVAKGVLDTTPNQRGDSAVEGGFNLYLWRDGADPRFIASLDAADTGSWGVKGGGDAVTRAKSAMASPGGRYLAFMSQRSLTGFDNREEGSGDPVQEVFRYDSVSEQLDCVSCNPSGTRPVADTPEEFSLIDPNRQWGVQLAAALPPANTSLGESQPSLYRPRGILDNGRVFFNAFDTLVPADSNGQWDVYQFEAIGVGDCTAASGDADTSRSGGGCVSLLSSGTADEEAVFLDASESGDDVFFLTPAPLSVADVDGDYDVYDARVNGIPATIEPSAECLGEACQPAPQVPNDPTPASAVFQGAGNISPDARRKRCPKGKRAVRRKGKTRCVVKKRGPHREKPRGTAKGRPQA